MAGATAYERRVADYHETVWGDFFLNRTFHDQETVNGWNAEIEELKETVRAMVLTPTEKPSEKLNLIDVVERLGIGYHFEPEIEEELGQIHGNDDQLHDDDDDDELSAVALRFRLLRQHCYNVPSDVFNKFKNEEEEGGEAAAAFKKELENDVEGMMGLYEAAYLRMHGETILDEAIEFTTAHLTKYSDELRRQGQEEESLDYKRVAHILRRPLRKGVERHEQLFFIAAYEQQEGHSDILLRLAKLSWNSLQHLYQQELRTITQWWIDLDFETKLSFARDRIIEVYFWAVGALWQPRFALVRYHLTKFTKLVSVVDDIYDVHGTIDELELFTSAVERWDTSMKDLPGYMKVYYKALIDALDEVDTSTTRQGRPYCADYGKDQEKNLMRAYLTQARWFARGEVPTIEEYRRVGVYSSAYPVLACSSFYGLGAPKEVFDWLLTDPKILVAVSDHCRLMDDIVSHEFEQERGHVVSSVEVYTNQHGVSTEEAVDALNEMVEEDWKDINEDCLNSPNFISKDVLSMFVGLARVMEVLYKDFDSYTVSNTVTRDMMTALLVTAMDV